MALTSVDFEVQFDLIDEEFDLTDTTDFSGQNVNKSDFTGVFEITDPNGDTIYNNDDHSNPDIDADVSLDNQNQIDLPKDSDGNVIKGEYTIKYEGEEDTGGDTNKASTTKTFDIGPYSSPDVTVTLEADCMKPLLTSTDTTNYTVDSTDPSITRTHKIIYPKSESKSDISGSGKTLKTDEFFTTSKETGIEHSSSVESTLVYTFESDFKVRDKVSASTVIAITCSGQICDVYCCLREQWNRYIDKKSVNPQKAQEELKKLERALNASQLLFYSIRCGKTKHSDSYLNEVLNVTNCELGCGCNDGEPQLVTGLGLGDSDVVVEDGDGTTVTSSTAGDVTTYTVSMKQTLFDKLNNLSRQKFTGGDGIEITKSTSGGVDTYTIKQDADNVTPDMYMLDFRIDTKRAYQGMMPTTSKTKEKKYGDDIASSISVNPLETDRAFLQEPAVFIVKDVLSDSDKHIFPQCNVVGVTPPDGEAPKWNDPPFHWLLAEVLDISGNDVKIGFQPIGYGEGVLSYYQLKGWKYIDVGLLVTTK